jgi:hypothetical protein
MATEEQPNSRIQGALGVGQIQPGSSWHVGEHPSSPLRLPSSHCSPGTFMPSPHTAGQG